MKKEEANNVDDETDNGKDDTKVDSNEKDDTNEDNNGQCVDLPASNETLIYREGDSVTFKVCDNDQDGCRLVVNGELKCLTKPSGTAK